MPHQIDITCHSQGEKRTASLTFAADSPAENLGAVHTWEANGLGVELKLAPVDAAHSLPESGQERALSLPGIEDGISDDEPVVEFAFAECREPGCGERSTPVRADAPSSEEPMYDWVHLHTNGTGHGQFYRWSLHRNTMRTTLAP